MGVITNPASFTRQTPETQLDSFNQWLRSQPWHQSYLQTIGQAGRPINLSERQQKELAAIARANGVTLPKDFSFDQGANLNQNSRLGRNLGIAAAVAGAAVGGYYALPAILGSAPAAVPATASTAAAATGTGAAATGGGLTLGGILAQSAVPAGIGAVSQYFGTRSANRATREAAQLNAEATQRALDFTKEQEAERKREWEATQQRNYELYQEQQARLEPYRRFGRGSLAQLGQPIYAPGSLGARMGA